MTCSFPKRWVPLHGHLQALSRGAGSCRTATAVWEKEIAVTGHNPIELPPPWCPDSHGSVSQRDAEPLGCTLKFGLAGCTKHGAAVGASQVSTFPFPPNMVTLSHFKMKYYVYLACLGLNTFPV